MSDLRDPRLDRLFIGYVRNSTEMQRDNYSYEDQVAWCNQKGRELGYANIDIREEQATSGQTIENRPVFQKVLADIARGIVGAVAAVAINRFTRDEHYLDGFTFFRACSDNDVLIVTKDITLDPRIPVSREMMAIMLMGSKLQNEANLSALMRGLRRCAEDGHLFNGVLPFGYDRTVAKLEAGRRGPRSWFVVNEAEARVVRLLHEQIQFMGTQGVADKLNRLGHAFPVKSPKTQVNLGRTERPWRGTDIRRILRNPLYMGVKQWGGERRDSKYFRDLEGPVQVTMPTLAIVDASVWYANKRLLESRSPKITPPRAANSPYLFSGVLKCGACHGPMKGSRKRSGGGGKQYRIYECSNAADARTCAGGSISERIVRRAVRRHLVQVLAQVGLDRVVDDAIQWRLGSDEPDQLEVLDERLAVIRGQQAKALHMCIGGMITDPEFKREREHLVAEERRIKQQRSDEGLRSLNRVTVEQLRAYMGADVMDWVRQLSGRRLSRVAKVVFSGFEVLAAGEGAKRRGKLRSVRYAADFALLMQLSAGKKTEIAGAKARVRRLSTLSAH